MDASSAPEQFPVAGRLTGPAVATVAMTIFGGLIRYLSQALIDSTGNGSAGGRDDLRWCWTQGGR
ncbi:hypothetical protein ACIRPU_29235 [Streptomyces sp. NPDC102259]|uniref:hypothetical protein n=1 Tax=Streptomyces sp. NPDC102259 TaxID=3366148 RepID=UPI00380A87E8